MVTMFVFWYIPHREKHISTQGWYCEYKKVTLRDRTRVNKPAPSFIKEEVCIITDESFHEIIFWERQGKTRSSISQSRDLTTKFPTPPPYPSAGAEQKVVFKNCKATR